MNTECPKSCNCRFRKSAWHCCSNYSYCIYIDKLEAAISDIAPWLSASLEEHKHDGKDEYLKACNQIFKLDTSS